MRRLFQHINFKRIVFYTPILLVFSGVSMLFAWAKDEGGLRDCVINNAIADTANVFAFPFIIIFNELGILNSLTSGIIGLLFNSSLYAFI